MEEILNGCGFILRKAETAEGKFKKSYCKVAKGRKLEMIIFPNTKVWELKYSDKVIGTGNEADLICKLIDHSLI